MRRASAAQSLTNTRQRARSVCSVTDPTPAVQAHARRQWRASASALEARACVGGARVRASTARVHMCVSSTAALACLRHVHTLMPIAQNGKRIIHAERSTYSFNYLFVLAGLSQRLSQKPSKNGPVRLQAQMIMSAAAITSRVVLNIDI